MHSNSEDHPPTNRRRWLKVLAVAAVVVASCLVVAWIAANRTAKSRLIRQIAEATGLPVHVDSVQLGRNGISASRLVVGAADNPVLTAETIRVEAPLLELLSEEPRIESLQLSSVTVRLTANQKGELAWPFEGQAEASLPSRRVEILNARLIVEQPNRDRLVIDGADLVLSEATDERYELSGRVGQLLGSPWEIAGDGTFGGPIQVELTTNQVAMDSQRLTQVALVPTAFRRLPFEFVGGVSVRVSGHASQAGSLQTRLGIRNGRIRLPALDLELAAVDASLRTDADQLRLESLAANLGNGRITGQADFSFRDPASTGSFRGQIVDVELSDVRAALSLPPDVNGTTSGDVTGQFRFDPEGALRIELLGSGGVRNASARGIATAPASAEVEIDELIVTPAGDQEIRGKLTLTELDAADVPIEEVLAAIGQPVDVEMHASGRISARGMLSLPLESASDVTTWAAEGKLVTDQLTASGVRVSSGEANFSLRDGLLRLDQLNARLAEDAIVFGSVQWPMSHTQSAVFELRGEIPASQLLKTFASDTELPDISGLLEMDALLRIPAEAIDAREAWQGRVSVSSNQMVWNGVLAEKLTLNGRLEKGELRVEEARARFAGGGEMAAIGRVPLTGKGPIKVEFQGRELDVQAIADAVRRISPDSQWGQILVSPQSNSAGDAGANQVEKEAWAKSKIDFRGSVEMDFAKLAALDDWNLNLDFSTSKGRLLGLSTETVTGRIQLRDEQLTFSELSIELADSGRIFMTGSLPVAEGGGRKANLRLQWQSVPLNALGDYLGSDQAFYGGTSGQLTASGPTGRLPTLRTLAGRGTVTVEGAGAARLRLEEVSTSILLRDGRVSFPDIQVGGRANAAGDATVDLFHPFAYSVKVAIADEPISHYFANSDSNTDAPLTGLVSVRATAEGQLQDGLAGLQGEAQFRQLQLKKTSLSDLKLRFASLEDHPSKLQVTGKILGGTVQAIADLPNSEVTEKRISVEMRDWRLDELTALAELGNYGLELKGQLDGDATITSWDAPDAREANIRLTGASGTFRDIPIGEMTARLRLARAHSSFELTGKALDGELRIEGQTAEDLQSVGSLPLQVHLQAARLQGLAQAAATYAQLKPLSGIGNLDMQATLALPSFQLQGSGDVELREVQWDRRSLSQAAKCKLILNDRYLRLQSISANVAGGTVRGSVDWPLSASDAGDYDLSARRLEVARLLQYLPRDWPRTNGTVEARLAGRIGQQIVGRGDVRVNRLVSRGLEASGIQLPISYSLRLDRMSGQLNLRRAHGRIANGRVTTDGTVEFGRRLSVNLQTQLAKLDFAKLTKLALGNGTYGRGRLSGTLKLTGTGMRSVRDLDGRFRGRLENTQAMQLPVLEDLVGFTNVGTMRTSTFDSDQIDLRLHDGILSTPGLVFKSDRAELFVKGRVFLDQRLDLGIAFQTGDINPDFGLGELARSPLSNFALPGASVVAQSLEFLSDRVVYVHVGGTVRSPHFQLRTDRMLQDALLRYYLPTPQYQQTLRIR